MPVPSSNKLEGSVLLRLGASECAGAPFVTIIIEVQVGILRGFFKTYMEVQVEVIPLVQLKLQHLAQEQAHRRNLGLRFG